MPSYGVAPARAKKVPGAANMAPGLTGEIPSPGSPITLLYGNCVLGPVADWPSGRRGGATGGMRGVESVGVAKLALRHFGDEGAAVPPEYARSKKT